MFKWKKIKEEYKNANIDRDKKIKIFDKYVLKTNLKIEDCESKINKLSNLIGEIYLNLDIYMATKLQDLDRYSDAVLKNLILESIRNDMNTKQMIRDSIFKVNETEIKGLLEEAIAHNQSRGTWHEFKNKLITKIYDSLKMSIEDLQKERTKKKSKK